MADFNIDMVYKHHRYCKYCGKEIDTDSLYCRYCGQKQSMNKSVSFPRISLPSKDTWKKILRGCFDWALAAAICFVIGLIICLILCYFIGDNAVDETPLKGWGYILPLFMAYILYRILSFVYTLKGKKKVILAAFLTIFAIALIGLVAYAAMKGVERREQEYKSFSSDTINRTFLGSSFGDTFSQVEKTLNNKGLNPQSRISNNGNKQLLITNTKYGSYDVDTIFFTFDEDRMFNFMISINTIDIEDYRSNYTYNSLNDLLESKYQYKRDYSENYNNSIKYSDDSTEVTLWHRSNIDGYKMYSVELIYYDKASGYREKRDSGF